eukprot:m.132951 g.132951  ORF g.132951 m.132951 type:complete len:52 (-) comp15936_c0_seq1:4235-4390(-)
MQSLRNVKDAKLVTATGALCRACILRYPLNKFCVSFFETILIALWLKLLKM